MPYSESGRLADPAFRRERARNAASARTTIDYYVAGVIIRVAELTDEHRTALRRALIRRPTRGRGATDV